MTTLEVLFTGYAHVHFACFRPLYERLRQMPSVRVHLSGGLRTRDEDGVWQYDEQSMYAPFDVPADRVLPVEEIRRRDFDVLFAGNTKLIRPRSASRTVQIFHGLSFRNRAVRSENMGCDHYLLAGPYMHRKFISAGLLSRGDPRAVPTGFIKTDRLLDGSLDPAAIRRGLGFPGDRPVILYAPTGARKNSLETIGEAAIERLVESDRYDIVVKPHDHPKNRRIDWHQRLARFQGPRCRISRDPDVVPLLAAADLLISDASSVTSEFTLLDRPIVFLDVPKLIERQRALDESQLDLLTWGRRAGSVVASPDDLVRAVDAGLDAPGRHREVRQAMSRDLFYNPGRATDVACTWFQRTFLGRAHATGHQTGHQTGHRAGHRAEHRARHQGT